MNGVGDSSWLQGARQGMNFWETFPQKAAPERSGNGLCLGHSPCALQGRKGRTRDLPRPPEGQAAPPPPAQPLWPLSLAQRESRHQEFSGTFKNCEERNSREDSEEGERKRSVARGRQDKSRSDEEGNTLKEKTGKRKR